jgi:hypothetical protein
MSTQLRQMVELGNEAIKCMEQLETQRAALETRLNFMIDGFRRLFEEEDIQSIPSFQLLRMSYGEYLEKPDAPIVQPPRTEQTVYDPLFMPPSMRRSMKTRAVATAKQAATAPAPSPSTSTISSDVSPDFSQNLLDEPRPAAPKKISIKPKAAQASAPPSVVAKGPVYRLELQGVLYLQYGSYLYDSVTRLQVGFIKDDVIMVNGKQLAIACGETVTLKDIGDGMLLAADDKAYRPLTGLLAQSVGIYKDGELNAWA